MAQERKPEYVIEDKGYKTPCWMWQRCCDPNGYPRLRRWSFGRLIQLAYVWFYEQVHGRVPDGMELDHLCRVRSCVNPDHLEAVTRTENVRRSVEAKFGSRLPVTPQRAYAERRARRCRLSESDVVGIREALASGEKQRVVGEKYGVDRSYVSAIARGRRWA